MPAHYVTIRRNKGKGTVVAKLPKSHKTQAGAKAAGQRVNAQK